MGARSLFRDIGFGVALVALASSAAASGFDRARGLIGILPLTEVFGEYPCQRFDPEEIPLYPAAEAPQPMGRIVVRQGWTFPPEGGCFGLEVAVVRAGAAGGDERLPTVEFDYEQPGGIVLARRGRWHEIALSTGSAWVSVDDGRFLPVEALLKDRLTYVGGTWPVVLFDAPGGVEQTTLTGAAARREWPAEVLSIREAGDERWIQVRFLEADPCTGEASVPGVETAWLRFYGDTGLPAVWFHSRGC